MTPRTSGRTPLLWRVVTRTMGRLYLVQRRRVSIPEAQVEWHYHPLRAYHPGILRNEGVRGEGCDGYVIAFGQHWQGE